MATTERLPDISVLGRYTYLATEVVFGTIAAALLYRARAVRRAAVTIAAIYPIAYAWDRYTLEVGVFSIDLRTGRELAGIPIEEHLFAVVVPAFVLGVHETIHGGGTDRGLGTRVSAVRRNVTDARNRAATQLGEALPGPIAKRTPGVRSPEQRENAAIEGVSVDVADVR